MLSNHFLIDLAIILLSTKLLGIVTKKFEMPQVVGALLAGLILGPAFLNIVHETEFISKMSQLGVIALMFAAGLETDVKELKKCGKASFIIALIGVIVPLAGGFIVAELFNSSNLFTSINTKTLLQNIFIGVVLTATSVSITVETLQELGKLKTPSGTAILGAAVIDDILGIIILTIITGMKDPSVNFFNVIFKIIAFFLLAVIVGYILYYSFNKLSRTFYHTRRLPILAFSICLIMAFTAEHFFGIADIIGAYIAGIIISSTVESHYIKRKFDIISYMLLSPIFFANIGIRTTISGFTGYILLFTLLLLIIAIATKVIGCGLGAKICGYSNNESVKIGIGMISRGEVALIVTNIGVSMHLITKEYFSPIVIVVIITTLITPILLKLIYNKDPDTTCVIEENENIKTA